MARAHLRSLCMGAVLVLFGASPVAAVVIDFEDHEAANDSQVLIRDEYQSMGVTFVPTDDGATWGGMHAGDPGGWQIDGSNGATFLGFDGQSYATTVRFDEPVEGLELDVARAAGAPPFFLDYFQVVGFLGNQMVESDSVYLGDVGDWRTVALDGPVDFVIWFATGLSGHRYAIDNLSWVGLEPLLLEAEIDVRPGSVDNPIQLRARGVVPVVLYGEVDFDVESVDVESLRFGPAGAGIAHRNGPHFDDVDGDGVLDMITHHRIPEIGLESDDAEACLTGMTLDGMEFEGCDAVLPIAK